MSLLDTFVVAFQSEGADKVKQDTQSLKKEVSELSDSTDKVTKSSEKLKQEEKQLENQTESLSKTAIAQSKGNYDWALSFAKLAGTVAAVSKLYSATMNVLKQGEDYYLMAKGAGVAVEKVQQLGLALENYGGSASSASAVLKNLNKGLQDLRFGKGGALGETAMLYGLNLGAKNADQLLENIAKRMETLNDTQKVDFASRLGLDNATMMLVSGGVKKFREEMERAKKAVPFTSEDIENSRKLQVQIRELGQQWEKIRINILLGLMPVIKLVAKGFEGIIHIFQEHKGFLFGFFSGLIALVTVLAVKTAIAVAPWVLIIGAITAVSTAIGLLVDDIVTFVQGGESYTGDFVKWLKDKWNDFAEFMKDLWDGFTDFMALPFEYLLEVPEKLKGLWDDIINGWKIILTTFFDWLAEKFSFVGKVADFVAGFFDSEEQPETGGQTRKPTNFLSEEQPETEGKQTRKPTNFLSEEQPETGGQTKTVFNADNEIVKVRDIIRQPEVVAVALPQMQMTQTPLNSMTSNQMTMMNNNQYYDQNMNNSQAVNVSGVTINTQATNAKELAKDFKQSLISEFQGVAWQNGSGEL